MPDPLNGQAVFCRDFWSTTNLINTAFLHDRGDSDENVSDEERTALADYLGCNDEARQDVLAAWQEILNEEPEIDVDEAEYWLDVEFIEPCPE